MAQGIPAAAEAAPHNIHSAVLLVPPEIWRDICNQIDNKTIKSLRATCRFFSHAALLRLIRVFVSFNPRNVETFTAIARHKVHRHQITEIVWDDVALYEGPTEDDDNNDASWYDQDDEGDDDDGINRTGEELKWYRDENEFGVDWTGNVPKWYREACKTNIFDLMSSLSSPGDDNDKAHMHPPSAAQLGSHMPVREAWAYYQELLQQQREVLASQAHIKAFEDHVGSFPALRRITITPATYGRLFCQLYETPMIRAFPRGFNFPIPRGWPVVDLYQPDCPEWEDDGSDWQGFRVVARALAENKDHGRVPDIRVDACQLQTGLNSLVFEAENNTFRHFEAVLARPNFAHLHLDLMVDPYERQAEAFQSGLLKRVLAGAAEGKGLRHLSIGTNIDLWGADGRDEFYVVLETIFSPATLSRVEHFGLSRFYVTDHDILRLLASLPQTLRIAELNLLEFMDDAGNFRGFLNQVRDNLDWQERTHNPSVRLSIQRHMGERLRQIWVDKELDSFLYGGGVSPFGENTEHPPNLLVKGNGRIKDAFMSEFEEPYVDQV